jgi:hypothetical protein
MLSSVPLLEEEPRLEVELQLDFRCTKTEDFLLATGLD